MPTTTISVSVPIQRTPRVQQVEGLFDLAPARQAEVRWDVTLPIEERPWHIGLIVGPSGCGKSTIARRLWPFHLAYEPAWPADQAILDAFPKDLSIKEIVALLSSVGFSSPPAWLRPFHVLSTGQQFRVRLAVLLGCLSRSGRHGRIHLHRRSHRRPDRLARLGQDGTATRPTVHCRHLPRGRGGVAQSRLGLSAGCERLHLEVSSTPSRHRA